MTLASVVANDRGKPHLRPRLYRINITREYANTHCVSWVTVEDTTLSEEHSHYHL